MLKRKRSWEVRQIQDDDQAAATSLVSRAPFPQSRTQPPTSFPGHGEDVRLQSPVVNGSAVEAPWKQHEAGMSAATMNTEPLPNITRKITACAVCRKQKIKCEMPDDRPPCVRCARRGLDCVLNKSLQTLLDDTKQTELLQRDVYNLHETLDAVCSKLGLQSPRPLGAGGPSGKGSHETGAISSDNEQECELSPPASPTAAQAPIDTFLGATKLGSPTSPDTPRSLRQPKPNQQRELIARGIVSFSVAETLTQRYFSRLDHYLYGIGTSFGDLQSIRSTSPILVAAICTVSALQDPKDQSLYESCNREFRRLISRSVFEKRGLDHLQALCIGSFWLTDASRILSSDAVRRAADVRLHKHFQQLLEPEQAQSDPALALSAGDHTNRIRLWYLLFICDQHLSILHNRDPLLRTDKEITANWEAFLEREGATDSDVRLMSQVSLLLIMGQVRDTFGSELDDRLAKGLAAQMTSISRQLDKWFAKFSKLFQPHPYIGDFPTKGLQMHYQFGKLYLGHHAFKGLKGDPIPAHFLSSASIARDAAVEIFDMILRDSDLQQSLVGMPHYFHIMIAFAGHFLLEVCNKYHEQLSIDLSHNFALLSQVLSLFRTFSCIPQHPISRMTAGLARKLSDSMIMIGWNQNVVAPEQILQNLGQSQPGVNEEFIPPPIPVHATQPGNQGTFDPSFVQVASGPNDVFFSDFEQFSFPDMTVNFMT
ncbi:hypothetical protein LTS07_006350 [Exophiala sideris]|uniref:Zn(2)-C6 fungal-type domain-containing protein n=1 Tax=Exophiala sideris TaxID=1016849 RepID=A0ABR0J6G6_9EURO|nr:hypothetical protein LTS07_006350 [Exophiala sideris]KAK5036098.1 hypothetical protein LTR13_005668 [Exophiala sideris]KAK5057135.1 hypothetical protein LTR69_007773 [Exophiala sideris]KAK5181542.1 hypothetical protein LTR44_006337 [Eurotiomycetes sp. CCFEE 6388]